MRRQVTAIAETPGNVMKNTAEKAMCQRGCG